MDSRAALVRTQEKNLKLINEIKNRPCLYNKSLISYSRKSVQDKAWNEVSQIMGWPVDFCRERWRNIYRVYGRHMQNRSKGLTRRPYYLMEAMSFAFPHMRSLKKLRLPTDLLETVDKEAEPDESEAVDTDNKHYHVLEFNHTFEDSSQPATTAQYPVPEPEQIYMNSPTSSPIPVKTEEVSQPDEFDHLSPLHELLKSVKSRDVQVEVSDVTPQMELQNDAKKMFLLSLLPDVYAMSDFQMRKFKREVLNLIGDILEDTSGPSNSRR